MAILANLHAHRAWCWNLGFPGWPKTFGLIFSKSVVAAVWVSLLVDLLVSGQSAFVLVRQENGEMGVGCDLCCRRTEKHGHPMDASLIVVVPDEMVSVSIRHVLLSLGHCVSDGLV